jgi:cytochrome c553
MPRRAIAVVCLFVLFAKTTFAEEVRVTQKALTRQMEAIKSDPQILAAALETGREQAAFCSYCHGPDGNSSKSLIPNLAGQDPYYLLDQIERFADGRRNDFIMSPQARQMTPEEKVALAVYYASATPRPARDGGYDATSVGKGRSLYAQSCQHCHGADGHGTAAYPRIAGQHAEYVRNTLKHFRDEDKSRQNALMAAQARGLADADIEALTAYIVTLR